MVSGGSSMAVIQVFLSGATAFSSKQLLNLTHEVEWTLFQTHYFSENLVALGIKIGPLYL
jgi:hypothetical protein